MSTLQNVSSGNKNRMKLEERNSFVLEDKETNERIFGISHIPLGQGPFPAVAFCHGFGGTKSGRFRFFVTLAEELAHHGIAVFRFDYRGSGDSEGDPMNLSFQDHIKDTLNVIEFMKHYPNIDRSRLGICGKSMGGAIATLAADLCGEIQVLALLVPMYHAQKWQKLLEELSRGANVSKESATMNFGTIPRHLLRYQGFPVSPAFVDQLFSLKLEEPLARLQKLPLLIVEAGQDEIVEKDHIAGYLRSREKALAETKHCFLEKSDHNFSHLPDQKSLVQEVSEWFLQHLV